MDAYIKQAWSLVTEYFHSNQIDPSKQVDHELVRLYLKACQKSTPRGIRITQSRRRLFLRFKTATKSGNSDITCNEDYTRDGCVNALAKALFVAHKLNECETEMEFWSWYETQIKEVKILKNDIITIGNAIETVRTEFFKDYDKCGRNRNDDSFSISMEAAYDDAYGRHHTRLNPDLNLTANNLISEVNRVWKHLGHSSGFRTAKSAVCKLLRVYRMSSEVDKYNAYFGNARSTKRKEIQLIDLEAFLDFRDRVLGLNGHKLTTKQRNALDTRKSWFKAFCINLLYGFRASEFKAILNLDEPVKIGKRIIKALHDPDNDENILVVDGFFWVIDDSGQKHKITTKTGARQARPMIHPDYPNLIELLDIKNPTIQLPVVTPKHTSNPRVIKGCYSSAMWRKLNKYIDQVGEGFTQTHALRHLANYHGKLSGLTVDQRSLSFGHSNNMNDLVYNKHLSPDAEIDLLMADISEKSENQQLKEKLSQAYSKIDSLEETILFLKKENARLNELLGGNDDLPRIGQ